MNTLASSASPETSLEKLEARFLGFAFWIPFLAFAALGGFAAIARLRVGHWPVYGAPDPKDLHLPLLHLAALLSYPVAFVSMPVCLLLLILGGRTIRRWHLAVFALGATLWAFFLPTVGALFEWLID